MTLRVKRVAIILHPFCPLLGAQEYAPYYHGGKMDRKGNCKCTIYQACMDSPLSLQLLAKFLFFLILMFSTTISFAQLFTDEQELVSTGEIEKKRSYSATVTSTLVSSFHRHNETEKQLGNDFGLTGMYQFKKSSFIASGSAFQDLTGERRWLWGDSSLSFLRPLGHFYQVRTTGSLTAIIPASEDSVKNRGLRTGLILAPTFSMSLDNWRLPHASLSYTPSGSIYFYRYDVARTGVSNTQYSLGQRLRLTYAISDRVVLGLTSSYARSFTYEGNSRDSYGFMSSLGFLLTEKASLEMGHSTQGNPLNTTGTQNELVFFSTRESVFYASFGLRI